MDPVYSAFDPVVWLIFAAFTVSVYVIVKIYHHRYPKYPKSDENDET
jgi:hypothetical protein